MIVIQQITIDWTKATRSVEGGARRNAIAKAFVLPFPTVSEEAESSALSKSVFLHNVSFTEWNDFQILEKSQWIPPLELQKVSSNINPWVYTNLRPSQLDEEAAERGEYKFEPPKDRYGFRLSRDFDFPFTFKRLENNLSLEFSWQRWLHYFPRRNVETSKLALGQTFRLQIGWIGKYS